MSQTVEIRRRERFEPMSDNACYEKSYALIISCAVTGRFHPNSPLLRDRARIAAA